MNRTADIVIRQLVATGCTRIPWKKIRAALSETALLVAYEQGRKIGRREGVAGAHLAAEQASFTAAVQTDIDEVASHAARRAVLLQGLPSQPQQ